MIIIVKKYHASSSKAPRFQPHFNRELGKYYHTSSDYYGDLKKRGLEPYNPDVKPKAAKPLKLSEQAEQVIKSIKQHSDKKGNFKPSGRLASEMVKMGALHTKKTMSEMREKASKLNKDGGFSN